MVKNCSRTDEDVNEHERLFDIALPHKLKQRISAFIDILYFTAMISTKSIRPTLERMNE